MHSRLTFSPAKDDDALATARRAVLRDAAAGTTCPCCGQLVKVYKRRLHAEAAFFLLMLVRSYRREPRWWHIREVLHASATAAKATTDGAYLVHWGFVETAPHVPGTKSRGLYRPTQAGIDFVVQQTTAPARVHLLNNERIGCDGTTTLRKALGTRFDYEELMRP